MLISEINNIHTLLDFNIDSVIISDKALSLLDEVIFLGSNDFMYLEDDISSKRFRAFLFLVNQLWKTIFKLRYLFLPFSLRGNNNI